MDFFENGVYEELCIKYTVSKHLNSLENDPENNPFKSKYEARSNLQEIFDIVHKVRKNNDDHFELCVMESAVGYQLGVNYIYTEEVPEGQERLNNVIELIKSEEVLNSSVISILISTYNELGVVWSGRDWGVGKAGEYLRKAEKLYLDYKKISDDAPLKIDDHFSIEKSNFSETQKCFESLYTHTLYYLAQAFKNEGKSDTSAEYCMKTLRRQLKSESYKPSEWSLNCACLSQYFISRCQFQEAKHCLSCADFISKNSHEQQGDLFAYEDDKTAERVADIARCWVKYCLLLLTESQNRISDDVGCLDPALQEHAKTKTASDDDKSFVRFPLEVTSIEEALPHQFCVNYEDAKKVFLLGKQRATKAMEYFVMDGFVTDHVELNQDISRLYQHLLFFEKSDDLKCRMHKRRIDLLLSVKSELNPQFYMAICKQLEFELAETCSDMMDLKIKIQNESGQPPNNHTKKKINMLSRSGIKYFNAFLDTLRTAPGKEFPNRFDADEERPTIIAHFYIARLYGKLLASSPMEKLENLKESLIEYGWVTNYVEDNPDALECVKAEFEICKEMVEILPKSMDRLLR